MEQVSGQGRKSRNTAAEELSDNIETIEKTASVVVKGERSRRMSGWTVCW